MLNKDLAGNFRSSCAQCGGPWCCRSSVTVVSRLGIPTLWCISTLLIVDKVVMPPLLFYISGSVLHKSPISMLHEYSFYLSLWFFLNLQISPGGLNKRVVSNEASLVLSLLAVWQHSPTSKVDPPLSLSLSLHLQPPLITLFSSSLQ